MAELFDDPFALADLADDNEAQAARVTQALNTISPDCRRLLLAVYYEGLDRDALMAAFDYREATVLATRKSQCLARLRKMCGARD